MSKKLKALQIKQYQNWIKYNHYEALTGQP